MLPTRENRSGRVRRPSQPRRPQRMLPHDIGRGKPARKGWFVPVGLEALDVRRTALSDRGLRLMLILEHLAGRECFCFPSPDLLSALMDRHVRKVQGLLRELEADRWIVRVHGPHNELVGIILTHRLTDAPTASTPDQVAEAVAKLTKKRSRGRFKVVAPVPQPAENGTLDASPACRKRRSQHAENGRLSMPKTAGPYKEDVSPIERAPNHHHPKTDDDDVSSSRSEEDPGAATAIADRLGRALGPKIEAQIKGHAAELGKLLAHRVDALEVVLARIKATREPIADALRYVLVAVLQEIGRDDPRTLVNRFSAGKRLVPVPLAEAVAQARAAANLQSQQEAQERAARFASHVYTPEEEKAAADMRWLALSRKKLVLRPDGQIEARTYEDAPASLDNDEKNSLLERRDACVRLLTLTGGSSVDRYNRCYFQARAAQGGAA